MLGRYTKCSNWLDTILKTIAHMAILNHPPYMHALIQKLPNNLQTKWCNNIVKSRRKHGKIAGFGDLTKSVEYAAESANHPVYSKDTLSNAKAKPSSAKTFTDYITDIQTEQHKLHFQSGCAYPVTLFTQDQVFLPKRCCIP